jgi:hypothetical protein
MEGHVPAAVALNHFHSTLREELGRRDDMGRLGITAKCNDRVVF